MNYQPIQDFFSDLEHPDDQAVIEKNALDQVIPGVSSGALLQAMEDPTVFPEVARGDLYVALGRLRQQAARMSVAQHLDYSRFLARMGKVEAPEKDVQPFANVPSINIHFSGGSVRIGGQAERDITP